MKTLLAIIAAESDNERLVRHWLYFKRTKFSLLGCGTVDNKVVWPEPVPQLNTGELGTRMTPAGSAIWALCKQEIDIWEHFLARPEYDSVCIVEADNLFCRKPPTHPGSGIYLVTLLPNYSPNGLFSTPCYFSTPRWSDRKCTERLYLHGKDMYERGDHQHFISDRFPAHIAHKHRIPFMAQPAWSPSAFHWSSPDWKEAWVIEARTAIKIGCYCIHSCKHDWQLEAIKDLL